MEPLGIYNTSYKQVQALFSSRLKIQILLSVASGPRQLSELRDVTGSVSQAIIPKIRSLERSAFIEQRADGYHITPTGRILAAKISDLVMTIGELSRHQEFWSTHDIEGVPEPFLQQIGDLFGSDVKFDTTDDMFHVYTHFLAILKEAAYIHAISSMMNPELAAILAERVMAGVPVELVVNTNIAEGLAQEPFAGEIRKLKPYRHFKVWMVSEPLHLGITVTDKHLSLGLNKKSPDVYDSSADMYSSDPRARDWAERLFKYFRERAVLWELDQVL